MSGAGPKPPASARSARAAFAVAVALNLVAVYAPSDAGGATLFPYADKLAHVLVFALVAWTGLRAGVPGVPLLTVLIAHAAASEVLQPALLPRRTGDLADVLAAVVGVVAGVATARRPSAAAHRQTPLLRC